MRFLLLLPLLFLPACQATDWNRAATQIESLAGTASLTASQIAALKQGQDELANDVAAYSGAVQSISAQAPQADADGDGKVSFTEMLAYLATGGVGLLGTYLARQQSRESRKRGEIHARINELQKRPNGAQ